MKKVLAIIFLLNLSFVYSQYKFSKDILNQIEKDSVAWKYQTGATELSFSGYYKETLSIWDKNGVRKPKNLAIDSLLFVNSSKLNAKDYIINESKKAEIIIINEAHHLPKHRTFTKSLLKDLYNNGYRYLGLEALFESDINNRKFANSESGYYTKEPEFGNLISEAIQIGFTLFNYEASKGKNGKEREIEQAENIQKFIENNPKGKVLIHCGYAHAFENEYKPWEKAMAGRLKENLNIDPLTIDQTMFLEKSEKSNNSIFTKLNNLKYPILLKEENGKIFNGFSEVNQTDLVIIHPETEYLNNKPTWQIKDKKKYSIPLNKTKNKGELLILAYRSNEFEKDGIPADIIEITNDKKHKEMYLSKGNYTIVIKDKNYTTVDKYSIKIK